MSYQLPELVTMLKDCMWRAMDTRRGRGETPSWRDMLAQIAALLLLRWLDYTDAEREAIALFNGDDYRRVLPHACRWDEIARRHGYELDVFVRQILLPALRTIDADSLPRDLSYIALQEALGSSYHLDQLVHVINLLPFDTAAEQQAVGDAFGELIRAILEKGGKYSGEFATPPAIAELMSELANPGPRDRVFDPCFGTAELLIRCIRRLHHAEPFHTAEQWEQVQEDSIFGIEINPQMHLIGLTRVLLAGIARPGLILGDALRRPIEDNCAQRFDVVVAVPPWGKLSRDDFQAHLFPFGSRSREASFLRLTIESLREGGRAVLAMPEGFCFRGGDEQTFRRWLLKEHRLETVVKLPSGAFMPYTGIQVSLLVLRRGGTSKQVRFIELDKQFDLQQGIATVADLARDVETRAEQLGSFSEGTTALPTTSIVSIDELASRDWSLVPTAPIADEVCGILDELKQLEGVSVAPFSELATLKKGLTYKRGETVDNAFASNAIRGLLRVRDVDERLARKPSLYATRPLSDRAKETQELRAGDLVLTTSGTIGRVGIATEGSIGSVITNGLVLIRTMEHISGRYIASILRSLSFQELMQNTARGYVIKHLSIKAISALRIPVPPFPVQERVADVVEQRGSDALAVLRLILTEDTHPVLAFLEADASVKAVVGLRNKLVNSRNGWEEADTLPTLRMFGKKLQSVLSETRSSHVHVPNDALKWIDRLQEIALSLMGVATGDDPALVPVQLSAQSALLSILKSVLTTVPEAFSIHHRALERCLDAVFFLLLQAHSDLQGDAKLSCYQVDISEYDDSSTVVLEFLNKGRAPLLQLDMRVLWRRRVLYKFAQSTLLGGGTFQRNFSLPDDANTKNLLTIEWKASTSSLNRIEGELEVRVTSASVQHREQENNTVDIVNPEFGDSPYIVGNPVDRPEMFFGRDEILKKIRIHINRTNVSNVILLEGNRRTGKTSILKNLQRRDTLPTHVAVYASFQSSAGHTKKSGIPTDEVFTTIGRHIAKDCTIAGNPLAIPGMPDDFADWDEKKQKPFVLMKLPLLVNAWFREQGAFSALEALVQLAIEAVTPRRLLLMIDEFDKLQEGIDSGVTSPQVPENIRYLFQNYTGMAGILTGSRRIRRMREEYWNALFGFGLSVSVTALPRSDAERLVREPVAGRLVYQPEAVDRIVDVCASHPYFVQGLCAQVFEEAAAASQRRVSVRLVDDAIAEMMKDNEHCQTLWGYAGPDTPPGSERCRYALLLCHTLADSPDPVTMDLLESELQTAEIYVGDSIGNDLDHLMELELISRQENAGRHTYGLAVPLMGTWIQRHIDRSKCKKRAVNEVTWKVI